MQMTTTSPMHSFHAPYSKSKLARGIHRQGNGKKRKEKTGMEKKEVKKRKQSKEKREMHSTPSHQNYA
jgi:hypothetical protein